MLAERIEICWVITGSVTRRTQIDATAVVARKTAALRARTYGSRPRRSHGRIARPSNHPSRMYVETWWLTITSVANARSENRRKVEERSDDATYANTTMARRKKGTAKSCWVGRLFSIDGTVR